MGLFCLNGEKWHMSNTDFCNDSPNKTHDFRYVGIRNHGKHVCEEFQCRFCKKERLFPLSETNDREYGLGSTRF